MSVCVHAVQGREWAHLNLQGMVMAHRVICMLYKVASATV